MEEDLKALRCFLLQVEDFSQEVYTETVEKFKVPVEHSPLVNEAASGFTIQEESEEEEGVRRPECQPSPNVIWRWRWKGGKPKRNENLRDVLLGGPPRRSKGSRLLGSQAINPWSPILSWNILL